MSVEQQPTDDDIAEAVTRLHNRLAADVVKLIVKPILENGGDYADVMVVLTNVVVGIVHALPISSSSKGDNMIVDHLAKDVKKHLAKLRHRNDTSSTMEH